MIEIAFLVDYLEVVPTLTHWFRAQWPEYYVERTPADIAQDLLERKFEMSMNRYPKKMIALVLCLWSCASAPRSSSPPLVEWLPDAVLQRVTQANGDGDFESHRHIVQTLCTIELFDRAVDVIDAYACDTPSRPVLECAVLRLYVAERVFHHAQKTGLQADFEFSNELLTPVITSEDASIRPEKIRALVLRGDIQRLAPIGSSEKAGMAYRAAIMLDRGEIPEALLPQPLVALENLDDQETRRETRVGALLAERKVRRGTVPEVVPAETGILSYLSSASAPTSPFGQDTAMEEKLAKVDKNSAMLLDTPHWEWDIRGAVYRDAIKKKRVVAAMHHLAMERYAEFDKIPFPPFVGQPGVPAQIFQWWEKKQKEKFTTEQIAEMAEWKVQRKRLARWGYYEEGKSIKEQMALVKREERREELNIQFEYWAEYELGPWFKRKTDALTIAANAFGRLASENNPYWLMQAAARASDMQIQFMQAIYDSPLPPSMEDDAELIDIYRGAMDSKSEPYRYGAVKAYEFCVKVGQEWRLYNETLAYCLRRLNELEPLKYPVSEALLAPREPEIFAREVFGELP